MADSPLRTMPLAFATVAAVLAVILTDVSQLRFATTGVMIVLTVVEATISLGRYASPWDRVALAVLGVLTWLVVSGLASNVLSNGLRDRNIVLLFSAMPFWLCVIPFIMPPGRRTARTPESSPRLPATQTQAALASAISVVAVLVVAVPVLLNIVAERDFLRPRGVQMSLVTGTTPRIVVVNREDVAARYRLVVTRGTVQSPNSFTLPGRGRYELSVSVVNGTFTRADLYKEGSKTVLRTVTISSFLAVATSTAPSGPPAGSGSPSVTSSGTPAASASASASATSSASARTSP